MKKKMKGRRAAKPKSGRRELNYAKFLDNLNILSGTIEKLKKTEQELQAEVKEISGDAHTARVRYQAAQRKARARKPRD